MRAQALSGCLGIERSASVAPGIVRRARTVAWLQSVPITSGPLVGAGRVANFTVRQGQVLLGKQVQIHSCRIRVDKCLLNAG